MHTRAQKLAAEFLGTFGIVLFSAGALCVSQLLPSEYSSTAMLGQVGLALAYGLPFAALSATFASISGGHFNPALTIGYWVTSRLNTFDTLAYWAAQLAGAAAAAYTLRSVLPEGAWRAVSIGAPEVANGITRGPAMIVEGLVTFFLMLVFFAFHTTDFGFETPASVSQASTPVSQPSLTGSTADSGSKPPASASRTTDSDSHRMNYRPLNGMAAGVAGGLVITAGALFAEPVTGGSFNPARAFGPALAASHWTNIGVYWIGPLAGAMLAAWSYEAIFLRSKRTLS